jgi:RNA polymerase sigma-70 factor (ECF subfamily)
MCSDRTSQLQQYIDRLRAGDEGARDQLLGCAYERLRLLTRRMLQGYPRLRRWEDTENVLQNVQVRLCNTLRQVPLDDARHFLRLAARQIRFECIDLVRRYFGPHGLATHYRTPDANGAAASDAAAPSSDDPARFASWGEFHEKIDALPEADRELFDLLYYQGLTQPEAAGLLGVSLATLKRRWFAAQERLYESLGGNVPG